MKICKQCKATNDDNANTCYSCGAFQFDSICSNCGAVISEGNFCSNCGTKKNTGNKVCPNCGTEYNSNACPNCGYLPNNSQFYTANNMGFSNSGNGQFYESSNVQNTTQPKKKRLWLWVLGWILAFPIPLTILLSRNKNMNKKIKYGLISGAWVLFILFVTLNGGSSDELKNQSKDTIDEPTRTISTTDVEPTRTITTTKPSVEKARPQKNGFNSSKNKVCEVNGFSFEIPNYWGESKTSEQPFQYYAETNKKVAMLQVSSDKESDDNYDVSFDGLMKDNDNMIKAIESSILKKVDDYETITTGNVKGILYKGKIEIDGHTGYGEYFVFPIEEERLWGGLACVYSDNTEYQYNNDFRKSIKSIKKSSDKEDVTNETTTTAELTTVPPTEPPTEISLEYKNALKSAKNYISFMAFSRSGLIEQLEFEQYSYDAAVYGADNCGADWNEQAAKSAKNYLDFMSFSRQELIDQLVFEGFTYDQAVYGVTAIGY